MAALNGINEYLTSRIERIIDQDIKPILKKMYLKRVQSDIYGTIKTPKGIVWSGGKRYQRRYDLQNDQELYYEISYKSIDEQTAEVTLFMTHNAFPAPSFTKKKYPSKYKHGALLALLQSGRMGLWATPDKTYYFPRPAIGNLQEEVAKSAEIQNAINRGLKREGLRRG